MSTLNLVSVWSGILYYCRFLYAFLRCRFYVGLMYLGWKSPVSVVERDKNPTEIYIDAARERFRDSFTKVDDFNRNIESIVYVPDKLSEALSVEDNLLVPTWKRRIIYESTPRGNIIMFYDIAKQGFAYFSDQSMTYTILNAVAMKYVLIYYCRDFFVDETEFVDEGVANPFVVAQRGDLLNETAKKREHQQKLMQDTKNSSFAKLKKYPTKPLEPKPLEPKSLKSETVDAIVIQNRFIYLGKLINFSFIQPIHSRRKIVRRTPTMYDTMFGDVSNERVNYKLFKERLAAIQSTQASGFEDES